MKSPTDQELENAEQRLDAELERRGIDPETLKLRQERALGLTGFAAPADAPYSGFDAADQRVLH